MKRLAVGLLALVILIGCAAVYAADTGTGESLVTQGYLNDTYIPDVLRQAETRIAEQTKTVYDSVLADLNARHSADRTSPRLSGRKYHSGSDNHL